MYALALISALATTTRPNRYKHQNPQALMLNFQISDAYATVQQT